MALTETEEMSMIQEAVGWEAAAATCLSELSQPKLREAVALLKGIKSLRKKLEETFAEPKKKADEAKKAILDAMKGIDEPLSAAEQIIKEKIGQFYDAENERQVQEYADKMLAAKRNAEEMRRLEANALRETGEEDAADALMASDLLISPLPRPNPTKMDGVSVSERWSAEIVNKDLFLEFVVKNKEWRHLVSVNTTEANKLATAQKESFSIPGLRAVSKRVVSVRV